MSQNKKVRSAFPDILSDLIGGSGKTLREIARESGIGPSQLSAYQSGTNEPNMSTLVKLSEYFNVSVDFLVGKSKAPTRDTTIGPVCNFTGLSLKSAEYLHREDAVNLTTWRMDAINYLLESEYFPVLIDMIIGFATSQKKEVQSGIASNTSFPIITDDDIFRAKAADLLNWILSETKEHFAKKDDYRSYYRLYQGAFTQGASLEEIKEDMEKNGLIFDKKMFSKEV